MRGTVGTIATVSGFLVIPWAIGFSVGLLFLEYVHLPFLRNILGGIAATAAGLLIAIGIRLLLPHRRWPAALLFAGLAFGLITSAKLPLLAVLFALVPLSIAIAGIASNKGPYECQLAGVDHIRDSEALAWLPRPSTELRSG